MLARLKNQQIASALISALVALFFVLTGRHLGLDADQVYALAGAAVLAGHGVRPATSVGDVNLVVPSVPPPTVPAPGDLSWVDDLPVESVPAGSS